MGQHPQSESQSPSGVSYDSRPPKRIPLPQRTTSSYNTHMIRWLLILLILSQGASPQSGSCRGERSPQGGCCRAQFIDQVPSCCRTHVSGRNLPVRNQADLPQSDSGEKYPCCGCCQVAIVYCLLPERHGFGEQGGVDRVAECHPILIGISRTPLTPPPNLNGVG